MDEFINYEETKIKKCDICNKYPNIITIKHENENYCHFKFETQIDCNNHTALSSFGKTERESKENAINLWNDFMDL